MILLRRLAAAALSAVLIGVSPGAASYAAAATIQRIPAVAAPSALAATFSIPPDATRPAPTPSGDSPREQLSSGAKLAELPAESRRSATEAFFAGTTPGGAEPSVVAAVDQNAEATAVDSARPLAARLEAVKTLQAAGTSALAALERVACANANGGSADYEVHRAARRAQADLGEVKSLRAVSAIHQRQILEWITAKKPDSVFDYDDTLMKLKEPVSAGIAGAIGRAGEVGVKISILTDRPDAKKNDKDVTILDSLSGMTAEQKANLTVGSNSGARLSTFQGTEAVPIFNADLRFTDAERQAIEAASAAAAEKFGRYVYNGAEENLGDFKWVRFLPLGISADVVQDAARFMQAHLDAAGVKISVAGRQAASAANPSYLSISLLDKSVGVAAIRSTQKYRDPMLIVGDSFFASRTVDSDMLKSAPGALAIAVGGVADPRLDNIFVWPAKGEAASQEILDALGAAPSRLTRLANAVGWDAPAPPAPAADAAISTRTLWGLIFARLSSMSAYMAISIAFIKAVRDTNIADWGGYGILMSLSPLAGIAASIVMGNIVKKFNLSARNTMALNVALRVVSLMALPLFHVFGVVNFGTLLLGALAEGWLLSSILSTEGAFMRVLFPAKQLGNVNGFLFQMFPAVQVVLGLFLGVGHWVDGWSPFTVFAGAAAVNLFMVLPTIWKTVPNIKLSPERGGPRVTDAAASLARTFRVRLPELAAFAAGLSAFIALTWGLPSVLAFSAVHGLTALGAAAAFLAAHPALSAPWPIVAALLFWISRSDAFRALRAGRAADAVKEPTVSSDIYKKRQLKTVGLMALGAIMYYPMYLVAAPHVAEIVAGAANKGALFGEFMGALFFGSWISTAARSKLPSFRLWNGASLVSHRLIQGVLTALAGLWVFVSVLPQDVGLLAKVGMLAGAAAVGAAGATLLFGRRGEKPALGVVARVMIACGLVGGLFSIAPIAAGAAAGTAALIAISERITERGWIKYAGVGFAAVWLPFLVMAWPALIPFLTVKSAMFLSLLAIGLVNGPSFVSLISYLMRNTSGASSSQVIGIQGAVFNAAVSIGYILLTIASGFLHPTYPLVLAALGTLNLIGGYLFWRSPSALPGLPEKSIEIGPARHIK